MRYDARIASVHRVTGHFGIREAASPFYFTAVTVRRGTASADGVYNSLLLVEAQTTAPESKARHLLSVSLAAFPLFYGYHGERERVCGGRTKLQELARASTQAVPTLTLVTLQ